MRPEDFEPGDLFTQIHNLVERLAAERRAREAAEGAERSKSELLAMIGHELKAPVETLSSVSELLRLSPLDPAQRRYTEMIAQSSQSLRGVIGDIGDLTKLEAGRLELAPAEFDLHAMIREVGQALQARASAKGLTSGVDIGASCPQLVVADECRIRQVLTTLLDASLSSTLEGSVRLHASALDVNGRWRLRFDVTDTGRGYGTAERARLFTPVLKVQSAASASREGSGLELAIARKLALLMGGEVGCDSAPGKGSLYWFTLAAGHAGQAFSAARPEQREPAALDEPVLELAEVEAVATASAQEAERQAKLQGHLLVIENNAVNRMLIAAYLDEFGVSYEMVGTGAAALLSLAAKRYDLVLMGMKMPDLDGIEATKRIRALQTPSGEVPIVALVSVKSGDRGAYLAAGMDAYVSKPVRGRELYRVLARFLREESGEEPALLVG